MSVPRLAHARRVLPAWHRPTRAEKRNAWARIDNCCATPTIGATNPTLLVLDAQAGSEEQTLRHACLLKLLGIRHFVVAINKMDLVGYREARFRDHEREVTAALERLGIAPHAIVPVSARDGANLREPSATMPWHAGPTLIAALESLPSPVRDDALPLRLPVQDVYRFDARRVIAGRVESGRLCVGDLLLFSPSDRSARVAALQSWPDGEQQRVDAGDNASIVLDRPLVVERGDIASHATHAPKLTAVFDAGIFWLAATPLIAGRELAMQLATQSVGVRVQAIRHRIDVATLEQQPAAAIAASEIARVTMRSHGLLAVDDFAALPATGRFVLRDGFATVGGGIIDASGYPDHRVVPAHAARNLTPTLHQVTANERTARFGHCGAVVWLTGLSGAGKSTLAMALERRLFDAGYAVFVLDGDNVRRGLNANLGFSPEDRQENIRRVGEVAALFAESSFVCITAFISPFRDDRLRAREAARGARFLEVHVKADLAVCEARDPKALYRKARSGALHEFTGIDSPYEEPDAPELVIDTAKNDVGTCVDELVAFVVARCGV